MLGSNELISWFYGSTFSDESKFALDLRSAVLSFGVATTLPAFAALIVFIFRPSLDKFRKNKEEIAAVGYQHLDIIRHLMFSKEVIKSIKENREDNPKKIYCYSHLEKLFWIDKDYSFDSDVYRTIDPSYVGDLCNIMLLARNINIDITELESIYKNHREHHCDEVYCSTFHLIEKLEKTIENTQKLLTDRFLSRYVVDARIKQYKRQMSAEGEKKIDFIECFCAKCHAKTEPI